MKKRNLLTLTALCLSLGLAVTACQGPQGQQGEKGETGAAGKDGETPTIGANGNWFIGGKDTGVSAKGADGATPTIGENGNWWINGKYPYTKRYEELAEPEGEL